MKVREGREEGKETVKGERGREEGESEKEGGEG